MHYARRCTNFKVIGKRFYEIKLLFSNLIPDREIDEVRVEPPQNPTRGLFRVPGASFGSPRRSIAASPI